MQHITVVKYNPNWEKLFQSEKILIQSVLRDNLIDIFHIGSTAVKGLSAKPIIDIMPVVNDLSEVDLSAPYFIKIGYEYLGEFGIKGRRYLRKGGDERTHQIHIYQKDDKWNIERHLAVRDYLRAHSNEAQCYGKLKESLALKFPYDIDGYCNGKEKFIMQLEKLAVSWYTGEIRKAVTDDFDEIMQIWETENIRTHNFISSNYWKNNYCSVKKALSDAEIYVYTCKDKLAGFIGLNGNYIEGIFVDTNQQHKGIGSALIKKIKEEKSHLTLNVYKKNVNAVKFYLKNNFAIVNESIDELTNELEYTMQWEK